MRMSENVKNVFGVLLLFRVIALLLYAFTGTIGARATRDSASLTFEMSKERRKVHRIPAT